LRISGFEIASAIFVFTYSASTKQAADMIHLGFELGTGRCRQHSIVVMIGKLPALGHQRQAD
jgi:hypothetical protein